MIPASLAGGPLGTLIQLYLIQLNGPSLGVIYASLAVAAFNLVSIPASMFWGYATDRLRLRGAILVGSYGSTALILFTLLFVRSAPGAILVFSAFSFMSAAAATPVNLLIMETAQKSRWAGTFARVSMLSSIGNVGGLVLSTVWAQWLPLILLSLPLGVFALVSAILAFAMIREPPFVFEGETIVRRAPSFFAQLLTLPLIFLKIPNLSDFRRVFRGLGSSLTRYMPLFYLSIICFYLSSGVFNTSFVPALSTFTHSDAQVFAVILAGMVVQTFAFRFAGKYLARRPLASSSIQGLLLRGGSYALIGVFAVVAPGPIFIVPALVLYPIAAGIAFAAYYTSSNTMMFNSVQTRNPGSALGVYSAVVGLATLAGSLASGFVSVYLGFDVTFVSAGLLLVVGAAILTKLPKPSEML